MGLDMYLHKHIYIGENSDWNPVKGKIDISVRGEKVDVDINHISSIVEEVGYWRKANQIHNWFVNNVQGGVDNCGEYYVSEEKLKELRDICVSLYESKSISACESYLPTQSGFFFGSTEYDQYYWEDIKHTIAVLTKALTNTKNKNRSSFYYSSSW